MSFYIVVIRKTNNPAADRLENFSIPYGAVPLPIAKSYMREASERVWKSAFDMLNYNYGRYAAICVRDLSAALYLREKYKAEAVGYCTEPWHEEAFAKACRIFIYGGLPFPKEPVIEVRVSEAVARMIGTDHVEPVYPVFSQGVDVSTFDVLCKQAEEKAEREAASIRVEGAKLLLHGIELK